MDLEQMKEFMIESFRKFEEVDPEKSPHLYFTKELQKHLEVLEREARNNNNQAGVRGLVLPTRSLATFRLTSQGLV